MTSGDVGSGVADCDSQNIAEYMESVSTQSQKSFIARTTSSVEVTVVVYS